MNRVVIVLILQLVTRCVIAQADSGREHLLQIGINKTTSLIFPQVIKSIDRGSRDLFVQKVSGAENVLQLKAAKENFSETNLTVITADGKLYEFRIAYAANPPAFTLHIDSTISIYEKLVQQKKFVHGVRDQSNGMSICLKGICISDGMLYFSFELQNLSNISYEIDMLRFFTSDKKQSRRTARQQLDKTPLFIYHPPVNIEGQSKQAFIAAFAQFTIPHTQLLHVQVTEKNGGRDLHVTISNKKIMKARMM